MIALEVVQIGLPPQDFENEIGEFNFQSIDVFRRLVCASVSVFGLDMWPYACITNVLDRI
jgi:hypothetical protein